MGKEVAISRKIEEQKKLMWIEQQLVLAAWTLRRLPDREAQWIYQTSSNVVGSKRAKGDVVGKADINQLSESFEIRRQVKPGSDEIDTYEAVLRWLWHVPFVDDRKLVFAVVDNFDGLPRKHQSQRIIWDDFIHRLLPLEERVIYRSNKGFRDAQTRQWRRRYREAIKKIFDNVSLLP